MAEAVAGKQQLMATTIGVVVEKGERDDDQTEVGR